MGGRVGCASERGSVAILALWGVAVIAALMTAASFATRSEVLIARNSLASSRVRLAAEAGTQLGLARLLRGQYRGVRDWVDGAANVRIAIVDEAGKIDINQAPVELLTGLFTAAGKPRDEAVLLACNVLGRRGDSDPACPDGASGRSYHFVAPEELAQLPGMDVALYECIADSVTVATGASAIDPLSAPRLALLALPGATAGMVDSFIEARATFQDLGDEAIKQLPVASYVMASPHRDFTIEAVAATGDRARYRADLQVRLTGMPLRPYQIVAWRAPPPGRGSAGPIPP